MPVRAARRPAARVLVGLLFTGPLAFVAAGLGLLGAPALDWLSTWGSSLLFAAGTLVCAGRAVGVARDRGAWTAFALAGLSWTLANAYYALRYHPAPPPVLSASDAGYLAFPVLFAAGLLRYVRVRLPRVMPAAWLDAGVVGLGAAAVIAALIFTAVTVHGGNASGVVTTLGYPLEDIAVVALLVGAGSVLRWKLGPSGRLIAAAIACITVSDVVTLTAVLQGDTYGGAWVNAGWSAGIALLATAAVLGTDTGPRRRGVSERSLIAVPAVAAVAATGVLIAAVPLKLNAIAPGLAGAAIVGVVIRLILTLRETEQLADTRRMALTDELTGLSNRRRLLADLGEVCADGSAVELVLLDLDGFKQFNDFHGHAAGDDLLAALGAALNAVLPARGRAYRLGGDEFCALLPAADAAAPGAREAVIAALTASGRDWSVAPSWGAVRIGEEATEPAAALSLADRRMYERKRRRPGSARHQVRDALLLALGEQQPALRTHAQDVTDQVERLARELGMSDEAIDDAVRAAELHDIGKLAIPAGILEKPGPLDAGELAIMRTHTIVGERMLLAAPALESVATIVRASHERWDGGGYPDGLAGPDIPLAARIVAVCDAFDAMVAERPYRPARTPADALGELRRCAGTQFDPRVVDAFAPLVAPLV